MEASPRFRWQTRGALELLRLHVEALFTCDREGRLASVNAPGRGAPPRVFVGVCPEGVRAWYRQDLEPALMRDLAELSEGLEPGPGFGAGAAAETPFVRRLAESAPVTRIWTGLAFRFPDDIHDIGGAVPVTAENASVLEPRFADWLEDLRNDPPFVAVLQDGGAVSICCSVRMTDQAHEAGVETHPDFRGRGFAVPAVATWARLVRERSAVPLYSTSWSNTASQAVARKLGLVQFCEDFHVT